MRIKDREVEKQRRRKCIPQHPFGTCVLPNMPHFLPKFRLRRWGHTAQPQLQSQPQPQPQTKPQQPPQTQPQPQPQTQPQPQPQLEPQPQQPQEEPQPQRPQTQPQQQPQPEPQPQRPQTQPQQQPQPEPQPQRPQTQPQQQPQPRPTSTVAPETTSTSPARPPVSLLQPSKKRGWRTIRIFRTFRTAFRSFPIITPANCKLPSPQGRGGLHDGHIHGGVRMTGTLFGHRKSRITLAIQENPRCLPMLLLELAIPTAKLLQEMATGMVRIALECEKQPGNKTKLIEEPVWTMYCNGRKTGYGTKREPNDDDLHIMQLLHAISMGAGVLPNGEDGEPADGELTYMRTFFERVSGSKDSETFYMLNPDGNSGPELSIFFVRI